MTLFSSRPAFIFFALILLNVLKADNGGLASKLDCVRHDVRDTGKLKGADEDIFYEAIQPKEDVFYDLPEQHFHDPTWRQIENTDEITQEKLISTVNKILCKVLGPREYKKYARKTELETGPYVEERPKALNQLGGQQQNPFSKDTTPPEVSQRYVDLKARMNKR
jgi:hypothetical protein